MSDPWANLQSSGMDLVAFDLTWPEALWWLWGEIAEAARIEDARACIWCVPFGVPPFDTIVDDALEAIVPRWPR